MATTNFVDEETVIEPEWCNDVDALAYQGDLPTALNITAGDTAAGDNAAVGMTAAEGLILTGQGSTNDVTVKNDADVTVASVKTGATAFTLDGGQLAFPAAQAASADANTLDDYEEGAVQVAFTAGTGTVTIDTDNDTIKYTKIGNLVHVQGTVKIASVSTPTGQLTMTGLPFTSVFGPELSDQAAVTCFSEALGTVLDGILLGRISGLQSSIQFFDSDSSVLTTMADHVAANTFITITASYIV